jgi:hypothetical protein
MTSVPPRQAIARALSEVEAAEGALASAMDLVEVAPRAEKIGISTVLEQALERLRSAHSELCSLEASLDEPAPPEPTK